MVCIPGEPSKLNLEVTLFVVPCYANTESDASLRVYMNGMINKNAKSLNEFVDIKEKVPFHPRYTLGAVVKLIKPNKEMNIKKYVSVNACITDIHIMYVLILPDQHCESIFKSAVVKNYYG